jgi:hypothetical protein
MLYGTKVGVCSKIHVKRIHSWGHNVEFVNGAYSNHRALNG